MAKILIVDDSDFIRIILKKYLKKQGHEVVGEATNTDDAIKLYKELKPDIITLDIIMPGDGMVALDLILKFDSKANILIYSSQGHLPNIITALKKGAKAFLLKPLCGETLNRVIEDVINNSSTGRCCNCIDIERPDIFMMSMFNNTMEDYGIYHHDIVIVEKNLHIHDNDLILNAFDSFLSFGKYNNRSEEARIKNLGNIAIKLDETKRETLGIIKGIVRLYTHQKLLAN